MAVLPMGPLCVVPSRRDAPHSRHVQIDFEARVREQNIRSQLTGRNRGERHRTHHRPLCEGSWGRKPSVGPVPCFADAKVPQGDALLEYGYRELSTTSGLEFSAKAGPRNGERRRGSRVDDRRGQQGRAHVGASLPSAQ